LPALIHVRDEARLSALVHFVEQELELERPGRSVVLGHLLELLFIEALRATAFGRVSGLLRGLADDRLALALRAIHDRPSHKWTGGTLAKEAAMSRSAFFERFHRVVGTSPMEYVINWRMALARKLLREKSHSLGEIANRLGYTSANSFSIAFTRRFGAPPTKFVG
jgi:AraC-like DNA-binding protein